ncbi:uncharacterized protein PGTG_19838 [Puccinia graminis f. sp. tritici CRL 75-36-700-3]|uniref:Threonylcarbamoyl-AMP synthase n=1 Tax=Puccinia graminis f. sp. tritici (strain CRL 75-36-700-3 / race SCCL) TaxID=418459 RepID=E3LB68_PUCGT|nr:uncharacterized protein PGTG_19838 [Puccinia graminis f. sp. tritici CRL 75-36-700-3]EFP93793.2 hypothetical protein PGTG_19838 [Puccinia graminis f. sp. tritici CRL 75-36-700-3]
MQGVCSCYYPPGVAVSLVPRYFLAPIKQSVRVSFRKSNHLRSFRFAYMTSTAESQSAGTTLDGLSSQDQTTNVIQCNRDSIVFTDKNEGKPLFNCHQTATGIQAAAKVIQSEDLVAFPTETVYGLGASALSSTAVSKIFKAKGRPSDNPLIVHVSSLNLLKTFVPPDWNFPATYQALIERFWPGPLTLLVPTTSPVQPNCPISNLVTCGLPTVAVRMPAHSISRALIAESGVPIAAPSANLSGRPSPTTAQHVERDMKTKIPMIIDGGACQVGVESTVVDGLNPDGRVRILRLGGLSVEDIEACLIEAGLNLSDGKPILAGVYNQDYRDKELEAKPTTPGMKYKHYAPHAKVVILDPVLVPNSDSDQQESLRGVDELVSGICSEETDSSKGLRIGLMLIDDSPLHKSFIACAQSEKYGHHQFCYSNLGLESQPAISAQRLFAALRYLDEELRVDIIYVERLSEVGLGATVMERLRKASGQSSPLPVRISTS